MYSYRFSKLIVVAIIAALVLALVPALPEQAEAAGGVMAYGDVVSGQLTDDTYFDLWQFDGTKGDRIRITMTGEGGLDAYLGLIDGASEEVLAEDDDSAGKSDALIETTLPSSGSYIIVATRYDLDEGKSTGSYSLQLAGGTGPQGNTQPASSTTGPEEISPGVFYMGDMALAEPTAGMLDDDAYAQIYTVTLEAGSDLLVAMFADESSLDPYIIVATEDGDILAEDDDSGADVGGLKTDAFLRMEIPATGTYLVLATRSGVDVGKTEGEYVLIAGYPEEDAPPAEPQENESPDGAEYVGELVVGDEAVSDSITDDNFVDLYTFSGQAGDQVTITMTGEGGLDAYLGLIDPNEEVIAEDDDSAGGTNSQISIRLPESGTYLIVATRNGLDAGSTTGDYTLEVTSGPPTGTTGVGGFGGLPGRAFDAPEGTFYLRGNGASDNPEKWSDMEHLFSEDALPGR